MVVISEKGIEFNNTVVTTNAKSLGNIKQALTVNNFFCMLRNQSEFPCETQCGACKNGSREAIQPSGRNALLVSMFKCALESAGYSACKKQCGVC